MTKADRERLEITWLDGLIGFVIVAAVVLVIAFGVKYG